MPMADCSWCGTRITTLPTIATSFLSAESNRPTSVRAIHDFARKYLQGVAFAIEYVDHIALTPAGKRRVVTVER